MLNYGPNRWRQLRRPQKRLIDEAETLLLGPNFFKCIYWACSTTLGSTTCRFNYLHVFHIFFLVSYIVCFLIITPLQCFKVYWFNKRAERLMILIYKVLFTCWPGSCSLYLGFLVDHWCLDSEKEYDSLIGFLRRNYTSLPPSGETDAGMPSSCHALSALLSFLGWALFWILVCPGLCESIAWLLPLWGSLSIRFAISARLPLQLLCIGCFWVS